MSTCVPPPQYHQVSSGLTPSPSYTCIPDLDDEDEHNNNILFQRHHGVINNHNRQNRQSNFPTFYVQQNESLPCYSPIDQNRFVLFRTNEQQYGTFGLINPRNCRHYFVEEYSWCGILSAIILFPLGMIVCLATRKTRCLYCGNYDNRVY
jgi:hypothetical protein